MEAAATTLHPVVFFDGVCGLCNGFVDRLMRWDRHRVLRYATLQGRTAQERLPADHTEELNSIVFFDGERLLTRSTAALHIIMKLGGAWKLAGIFLLLPHFIRDGVYNWIARNRYQWFGKHDTCRLPSPEERALFLP
ncbi:MAG TPA: DCC1-like thiol-disulfide oxidoreductase family protein [Flavobacteriales bacterium]|nr:DCC1-like thiol-disulfide oxidoreductase family protein [Flavobacteriales bacterium]